MESRAPGHRHVLFGEGCWCQRADNVKRSLRRRRSKRITARATVRRLGIRISRAFIHLMTYTPDAHPSLSNHGRNAFTRSSFNARPIHPALFLSHQSQYSINHPLALRDNSYPRLWLLLASRSKTFAPRYSNRQRAVAATTYLRLEGISPSIHLCLVPRILPSLLLPSPIPFHPAFHSPRFSPKPHPSRLSCLSPRLATPHLLTFWL